MKIKRLTFSLIFLLLFSGFVYGNALDDGFDATKRRDYKTAYKLWLPLAEQRNAIAQFNLGAMYDQGKGVFQNVMIAFNWYKLSAEQGYLKAQFNLGEIYREGEFVTRDFGKALKWYRLSAAQGLANAQCNLGLMYERGKELNATTKKQSSGNVCQQNRGMLWQNRT